MLIASYANFGAKLSVFITNVAQSHTASTLINEIICMGIQDFWKRKIKYVFFRKKISNFFLVCVHSGFTLLFVLI